MERMASSAKGGVLADDDKSEGEGGKRERSGSRFRNSLQSESKLGSSDCSRSSCGISSEPGKPVTDEIVSVVAMNVDVNTVVAHHLRTNSPGVGKGTQGKRDGGLKKSRSNEDGSSGSMEAGFGIWKD